MARTSYVGRARAMAHPHQLAWFCTAAVADFCAAVDIFTHPPRILLLYGSLRARSYSRFAAQEAERLLRHFGCETRIYDPAGLPLPDDADAAHPKVQELRDLSL